MLKKLNKREVQSFVDRFEIKCDSITLEQIQDEYFIIINELIRLHINGNLIPKIIDKC